MDPLEHFIWVRSAALAGTEGARVFHQTSLLSMVNEHYMIPATALGLATGLYRGRVFTATNASFNIFEPGESIRTLQIIEPGYHSTLFLPPERVRDAAREHGQAGEVHFPLVTEGFMDRRLFRAVEGLVTAMAHHESPLEEQTWLTLCLHGLLANAEHKPRPPSGRNARSALQIAKTYLRDHWQDPVSLDDLSAATALSRFTLVHAFTAQEGLPPHTYQLHLRIEHSRELLEKGIPLAKVATDTGFADQSHFARHFQRVLGTTPGEYARAARRAVFFS
jgi:AraC-like DNA-binding protein